MKNLNLVLTNNCNQNCTYCYQIKDTSRMSFASAKAAVEYFANNCTNNPTITFFGGEPFLEFELMQRIIALSNRLFEKINRTPLFNVTTNGTLLDRRAIEYCLTNKVAITLSLDGDEKTTAMNRGLVCAKKVENTIKIFQEYKSIIQIISVITPNNANKLFDSVNYFIQQGAHRLQLIFQLDRIWKENEIKILESQYEQAYAFLKDIQRNGGKIIFNEYNPSSPLQPVFKCYAGKHGFIVTPGGHIYACLMMIPWSKSAKMLNNIKNFDGLCLGHVKYLSTESLRKALNKLHSDIRFIGQYFKYTSTTKCAECEFVGHCAVCPGFGLIFSNNPFYIPDWICEIKKITYRIGQKYLNTLPA